jgi:hypothetical protein
MTIASSGGGVITWDKKVTAKVNIKSEATK